MSNAPISQDDATPALRPVDWLKSQKSLAGPWLSLAVGLGVMGGFLLIVQAWLLANTVNRVIFEDGDLAQVSHWLWLLLAVFALRALLAWSSEQAAFRAALQVKLQLRDKLFRHLQALGPVRLGQERTGELVNSLSDGVEALEAYYARFLPAISLMALVPLSILVFVFPMDWLSALIMLGTAPLIPLFMILIGKGAERLNQKQWRKLARLSAHFLDAIQGLTTLKLFNASRREAAMVARISDEYRRSTMAVLRVAFLSSLVLEFFATVSIALVAVSIGFRLFWGEMDFLPGFFILLLAPEFYLPLRNMGTHYHARMEGIGAAERLQELLAEKPPETRHRAAPPASLKHDTLRFDAVHYRYPGGRQALSGLDLTWRPGERLALVGPSGAGKSTVVNLLLGFIQPDSGDIQIGATALQTIDLEQWRRQLAWVPQRPRLFHGTLLQNIRLGRPDASLQQVRQAAQQAHIDRFIESLPQGYETAIGDLGAGLSGGQAQRIALARAFLSTAPLVILDEATAGLDPHSERLVQQSIDQLARGRRLLVIAHRLNTVQQADHILVLQDGRVVEQGAHDELLQNDGLYRRMQTSFGDAS
jgi:ATP-binding cassette subfamily C protein CydD